jgi:hypothetical protein
LLVEIADRVYYQQVIAFRSPAAKSASANSRSSDSPEPNPSIPESVRGVVTQAQHTAGQSLQEEENVGNTDLHPGGLKTPARRGFPQKKSGFRLGGLRGLADSTAVNPAARFPLLHDWHPVRRPASNASD